MESLESPDHNGVCPTVGRRLVAEIRTQMSLHTTVSYCICQIRGHSGKTIVPLYSSSLVAPNPHFPPPQYIVFFPNCVFRGTVPWNRALLFSFCFSSNRSFLFFPSSTKKFFKKNTSVEEKKNIYKARVFPFFSQTFSHSMFVLLCKFSRGFLKLAYIIVCS